MTDIKTISTEGSRGIGFFQILFVTFLVLKLAGIIHWSWWWVTAPLWIPWAIIGSLLVILAILMIAVRRAEKRLKKARRRRLTGQR